MRLQRLCHWQVSQGVGGDLDSNSRLGYVGGFTLKKAPSPTSPSVSPLSMLKSGGSADSPNSGPEEDMAFSGDARGGFRQAVRKTDSGSRCQSSNPSSVSPVMYPCDFQYIS